MYKMQRLEVSGAVRPIYGPLGVKRLIFVVRASTPSEGADSLSYFHFKYPRLHLGRTAPPLTAVNSYMGDRLAKNVK